MAFLGIGGCKEARVDVSMSILLNLISCDHRRFILAYYLVLE